MNRQILGFGKITQDMSWQNLAPTINLYGMELVLENLKHAIIIYTTFIVKAREKYSHIEQTLKIVI